MFVSVHWCTVCVLFVAHIATQVILSSEAEKMGLLVRDDPLASKVRVWLASHVGGHKVHDAPGCPSPFCFIL